MEEATTTISQNPVPATPPVQPQKGKKMMLMIVVHAIVIATIGYLVYQNMQFRKQISLLQPTPIASITPTVLPTTDPTANWKTYINNKYKYEIKFPSLWDFNRGPGNLSDTQLSNQRDIDIYDPNLPSENPGTSITIKVNELDAQGSIKNCTTLEDCIEKSMVWLPKTQEVENGETTFLGQQAKTIKYTRVTPLYSQTWKYVFVILNDNFYSFNLSSETKGFNENQIIFNQSLSTFKFAQ